MVYCFPVVSWMVLFANWMGWPEWILKLWMIALVNEKKRVLVVAARTAVLYHGL